jgi:DNA (cytosine-5)-methyltransferase 1
MSADPNQVQAEFNRALERMGTRNLSAEFGVDVKTLRRWEREGPPHPGLLLHALKSINRLTGLSGSSSTPAEFTFVDLFAGIGGIRRGFEEAGGRCLFTSEWDRFARQTYAANFPDEHGIWGDIREITAASSNPTENSERIDRTIPDHDVLLAGFPCQPFSLAGVSKKNSLGREHGFLCETQGTLFFDVARIIEVKRPKAFLLENVKNLRSHDRGNTYRVIRKSLEELGYAVHDRVIDAKGFVPQHRERIYLAGFRQDVGFSWDRLHAPDPAARRLGDVLHPEDGSEDPEAHYTVGEKARVDDRYVLSQHLWNYLKDYRRKHEAKGNGFGYSLFGPNDIARTLSARYHKDGSEILISRGRGRPRRLTPRECARLMGFPDEFEIPVSDTQAYRQFGNSVVVPVIREIAQLMVPFVHMMSVAEQPTNQYSLQI